MSLMLPRHPRPKRPGFDLSRAFSPEWLAGPDGLMHATRGDAKAICDQPCNAPLRSQSCLHACPACVAQVDSINDSLSDEAMQEVMRIFKLQQPPAKCLDLTMIHGKSNSGGLHYRWALVLTDAHDRQHVRSVSYTRTGAVLNLIESHQTSEVRQCPTPA